MEIEKWKEVADGWVGWDGIYRTIMVVKWMEGFQNKIVICGCCGTVCSTGVILRYHVRWFDKCLDWYERLLLTNPTGLGLV